MSFRKVSKKAGLPPGELIHVGEKKVEDVKVEVISYSSANYEEKEINSDFEKIELVEKKITWVSVEGLHDTKIIGKIGESFDIHPLVLEDILNTNQRPKLDDFEKYLYVVLKMLFFDPKENKVKSEQVSLILGKNFVVSFEESKKDIFETIKTRIRTGKGRVRKFEADYLAYALLDVVIDNYFSILEKIGERIEDLEEDLMSNPKNEVLQGLYELKREMIYLRKSVWPLREVLSKLERKESALFKKKTEIYLKDLYDHTVQIIDTIETYRDMTSGMLDLYLSSVSNKMNEVMKVLTIISTIFIPLTFIAGIYGMNFEFMPELTWEYGYFIVLGIMLLISAGMLYFFRRKKWI